MKKNNNHFLSVVIPAYNQEKTIAEDLIRIQKILGQIRYDYEIVLVVDGRNDKTFEQAEKAKVLKTKIVGYDKNHGKGYAVRFGMARTKGDIVAFIDAGMDLDPNGLSMLLEHFEWYNADIIVGSKRHPVSQVNYPWQRRILSFGYQVLVKVLFGFNIRDTQVGMKFFRRKVLEDVLPRLLVKQYALDVEILAVAYRLGYRRIFEAPVRLDWDKTRSTISKDVWKISLNMLIDTLGVYYRLKIRNYYDDGNKRRWRYDPDLNFKVNIG